MPLDPPMIKWLSVLMLELLQALFPLRFATPYGSLSRGITAR